MADPDQIRFVLEHPEFAWTIDPFIKPPWMREQREVAPLLFRPLWECSPDRSHYVWPRA